MASPQRIVDPYQAQSRKSGALLGVGLVLLALLGGFAVGKEGLLGRVFGRGDAGLAVPGQANPVPLKVAETGLDIPTELGFEPQSPDLSSGYQPEANLEIGDKMPRDVRDWLLHLERTENERQRMTKAQIGQAMGLFVGATASQYEGLISEAFGEESGTGDSHLENPELHASFTEAAPRMKQGWSEINRYFNSKQPPAECVPIKNAYEQCLGETGSMMLDIITALEGTGSADGDLNAALQKLTAMQGTSSAKIDVYAKQSDQMVGRLCEKYDTRPWFSISGDIGGGLGLGLGGLGGGLGGLLGGG